MKETILLICLALISCYNRDKAYNYAKTWWNDFNLKKYANYNPVGGDCANFVSQCLIAGGLDLVKMCGKAAAWGKGGTIPGVSAMASCFKKKNWKVTSSIPSNFAKGDVILYPGHAVIAVSGYPDVKYAAHNYNRWMKPIYYSPKPTFYHYTGKSSSSGGGSSDSGCKKTCNSKRCVSDVANDVIRGNYGNGDARVKKLKAEGCDVKLVQDEVNRILS